MRRPGHSVELVKILDGVFMQRSLEEWEPILNGHALIWSPVREVAEVLEDEQARAMGYIKRVEHERIGAFETVGPPFQMSDFEMDASRPAPDLGADSEAVLREAGLDPAAIAKALERG